MPHSPSPPPSFHVVARSAVCRPGYRLPRVRELYLRQRRRLMMLVVLLLFLLFSVKRCAVAANTGHVGEDYGLGLVREPALLLQGWRPRRDNLVALELGRRSKRRDLVAEAMRQFRVFLLTFLPQILLSCCCLCRLFSIITLTSPTHATERSWSS